jgi:predicted AlkP superfamily phosphohydrolase/phosphomutase
MDEMVARHGADPKMETAYGVARADGTVVGMGFRNPSLYSPADLASYIGYLSQAVERRTAIALDLIARGPWDLMLGMFPETHTANHLFWHLGREYPVASPLALTTDPLRELYRSVDTAIGRIAAALRDDCMLLVATIDETGPNRMDVPSMALLPEILWRAEGPGEPALFDPSTAAPPPGRRQDYSAHWTQDVWAARTQHGQLLLLSPADLLARGDPIYWNPAWWYSPLWPRMGAFALPSVSDGHIRLNVAGREAHGIVAPERFGEKLARTVALVERLTDARTGKPAVDKCLVMRSGPDDDPHIPPDIVVIWSEHAVLDCLDHPQLGRVGPVPHFRSGGHRAHGTTICNRYIASGGAIASGKATAADGSLLDLPATLLDLLGAPPSPGMTGHPLIALADAAAP